MYEPDEREPTIVRYARANNLDTVREIVEAAAPTDRPAVVNASRRWTEVQEKWGYDKSWEWHGDTALVAAARCGHSAVVRYLLAEGLADPTLESCYIDDQHDSAESCAGAHLQADGTEIIAAIRTRSMERLGDLQRTAQAKIRQVPCGPDKRADPRAGAL